MEFQVNTNQVILRQQEQVESGEYNVTECNFTFSSEYDGLTKKAVFTGEDGTAYLQTIVDNKCSIPSEILTTSQVVQIGVYAYALENEELILRYSPEPTDFFIHEGSYKEAQNSTPPTPSEIEQLQSQITTNANNIEEIQSDVVDINTDITNIKTEQTEQNTNIQNNTDDITELQNTKANKSEIPTKTSDLINDSDFVVDNNYVHTDNNFTNEDKGQIKTNKDDISTINGNIQNINNSINDINQNIDDLEQDLTNYSLITETGSQINLNINSSNFQMTAILKDKNGNVIHTSNVIDLPLETMVVGASYDNVTKEVVLTLQNGTTLRFSVADLVSGLVSETQLQTILANYYTKTEVDNLLSEKANQTSLDTTNQNLTNLAGRVSTNEKDIADIKEEQTTQNTNIEELQSQVETLQEDLDNAEAEIAELNTDITNMRKAMITVEGQGTDITLPNTSENKFVEFGLEGRTEQEQLTGKNLLDGANPTKNNSAIVSITNNTIKVSSTAINTTPSVIYEINNVQQGDTYRINAIIKNSNGQIVLQTKQDDTWTTYVILPYINGTSITSYAYVIRTNVEAIRYLLYADKSIPTGASESSYENVIVTKNNADMTYEPYCGGIPSPNPDFPQQIKNVTGNANVKIENKNLAWTGWAEDFVSRINNSELANLETYDSKNCLRYNAGAGSGDYDNKYIFKINWKENTQYTLSYYAKSTQGYLNLSIEYTDGTISSIDGTPITNWAKVILTSTANKTIKYIRARFTAGATYIDLDTFMVEENTTATSYVEHQEQNYPFTFSEGQRAMEGTELLDDGIHNKRKQVVFDGSADEHWIRSNSTELFYTSALVDTAKQNGDFLCNYFTKISPTETLQDGQTKYNTTTSTLLQFKKLDITNITDWREWLSTHNVIVEYELSEEAQKTEIIPYNSIQQAQYNNIKANASSYDDITYISSESDEVGFDMKAIAVADANKVIDNQNNEIDTIKSRLDLLEG